MGVTTTALAARSLGVGVRLGPDGQWEARAGAVRGCHTSRRLRAAARAGGVEGAAGADRGAENKPRQRTVSRTALAAAPAGLRSLLT